MNLKVNVPVKMVSHNSHFRVKLTEVDTFYDDTLAERIQFRTGNEFGYLRDRDAPDEYLFEFFVHTEDINELVGEIKAIVLNSTDEILAESEVIDIPLAKEIISGTSAATYEFKMLLI
jgi:hypothetical protein